MPNVFKLQTETTKYEIFRPDVCTSFCVYFQSSLGTSLCKPVCLCLHTVNHIMCERREEKDKSPDTFLYLLFYLNNVTGFGGRRDGITDYASIMVCPVCLVGLPFDWIMIHWAVRRNTDEQRNISLHMYTSNYPSKLMNCNLLSEQIWFTNISQKHADDSSARITSKHQMWCYESQRVQCDVISSPL